LRIFLVVSRCRQKAGVPTPLNSGGEEGMITKGD